MKSPHMLAALALGALALLTVSCTSAAQFGRSRYNSPSETANGVVAGHKISIEYFAPSMHGRKIFGGLVPYNQVWCTGANYATALYTDVPLQMGTLKIPAGSHSIWTIPTPADWTLIINNQTEQSHLDYDDSQDFGRTKMQTRTLSAPVEKFKIEIRSDGGNKGTLALDWEKTEAYMPFTIAP